MKSFPDNWLYLHETICNWYTPFTLILKTNLFFYTPVIGGHKILMHLPPYLLLVCVSKFFSNRLVPFSVWLWFWMTPGFIEHLGLILSWLDIPHYNGQVNKKKSILFALFSWAAPLTILLALLSHEACSFSLHAPLLHQLRSQGSLWPLHQNPHQKGFLCHHSWIWNY